MRDYRRSDTNSVLRSRIARLPAPERVPHDREGLRRTIAEVTAGAAGVNIAGPAEDPGLVLRPPSEAQQEKDRILCEAWESLASDQQAALRVALGLIFQRGVLAKDAGTTLTRCRAGAGCFLSMAGFGVLSWMVFAHLDHSLTVWLIVAVSWWCLWRQAAPESPFDPWLHAREEDADLQVALAMDDPGRYLDALDTMARAEFAGWEALRGEGRMSLDFTRRRNRLCERLGFARPVTSG